MGGQESQGAGQRKLGGMNAGLAFPAYPGVAYRNLLSFLPGRVEQEGARLPGAMWQLGLRAGPCWPRPAWGTTALSPLGCWALSFCLSGMGQSAEAPVAKGVCKDKVQASKCSVPSMEPAPRGTLCTPVAHTALPSLQASTGPFHGEGRSVPRCQLPGGMP